MAAACVYCGNRVTGNVLAWVADAAGQQVASDVPVAGAGDPVAESAELTGNRVTGNVLAWVADAAGQQVASDGPHVEFGNIANWVP